MLNHLSTVMAGLVPATHALLAQARLAQARQERRRCPGQARAWRWRGDSIASRHAL